MDTKKLSIRRILIYVALTFCITYALEFAVITPLIKSENLAQQSIGSLLIACMMFIPAICVLITRLITKEGFKNAWLKPNFKGHIRYYLMGWFGPAFLIALGALIYFLFFPKHFDLQMGDYIANYRTALLAKGITMTTEQIQANAYITILVGIFLGPLLNIITCFGEEWGWRGYLLPKMKEHFSVLPMLLINGIIWGLWHAPLTMLGHNYGTGYPGFPYLGILAMCIFCIVNGTLLSFLSWKTQSCWPAVLAHGSLNGFAGVAVYFTIGTASPFIGPLPTGIIGGSALIMTAIVLVILWIKKEKSISHSDDATA